MSNKLVISLCAVTLLSVFGDIVFLHPPVIHAQTANVHVEEVPLQKGVGALPTKGQTVVGFSCTEINYLPRCFVASR